MAPSDRKRRRRRASFATWAIVLSAVSAVSAARPEDPPTAAPADAPNVSLVTRRAADPRGWAYRPTAEVEVPAGEGHPIDRLLLGPMRDAGVEPAPEADRRTLIRRATLDLHGLLPTPDEVERFVSDPAPDAFERLVDRLLESPRYGERWGRHWLDVVRYADSNGQDENTAFGNAHRYRDWVIAALNRDEPFDRFAIAQIAGDLLPPSGDPAVDQANLVATGFLALGPKFIAEPDVEKMLADIADEQVDTIGKAFLAQTLSCARCHDHKFDPVTQRDYFAMYGILRATRTLDAPVRVARLHERPLGTADEIARVAEHAERTRSADAALGKAREELARTDAERRVARIGPATLAASSVRTPFAFREAEPDAARGDESNLVVDQDTWGRGIGVARTGHAGPQRIAWSFELPAGEHELLVRRASREARPVRASVDGSEIAAAALAEPTGEYFPIGQRWDVVATFTTGEAGRRTIALDREGPFAHLDLVAVAPPGTLAAWRARLADEAARIGVDPAFLERAVDRLERDPAFAEAREAPDRLAANLAELARRFAADAGAKDRPVDDASLEPLRASLVADAGLWRDPPAGSPFLSADERAPLAAAEAARRELDATRPPPLPYAIAVRDHPEADAVDRQVHVRGDHTRPEGEAVPRGVPAVFRRDGFPSMASVPAGTSGRLELARWIADPANPLFARVAVNRLWQGHFGRALAVNANNFGLNGAAPTHPELLDWLAGEFARRGFRLKAMHRLVMTSDAWRRSSGDLPDRVAVDPDNRLWWRQERRRVEAEAVRDLLLQVGGTLDLAMGGSLLPVGNFDYVTNDQSSNRAAYDAPRRSVYLPVIRNAMFEGFSTFDFVDSGAPIECRARTTVAPQALYMLNAPLVRETASRLARATLATATADAGGEEVRIDGLYARLFGRPPVRDERDAGLAFLRRVREPSAADLGAGLAPCDREEAWARYAQVLLATSEFITME
jgi:hypothetical protein